MEGMGWIELSSLPHPPSPSSALAGILRSNLLGETYCLVNLAKTIPSPPAIPHPPPTRGMIDHYTNELISNQLISPHFFQPMEDLMLSSVHAFTVELRLASESVLSKAR